jgi:hypothetical protein
LTSKNIASLFIKVRPLALSQNKLSSVQELQQAYLSYCKVVLLFLHYNPRNSPYLGWLTFALPLRGAATRGKGEAGIIR